jgi:23S rRNA pseudouridine1911/1915/1917 synthase
MSNENKNIDIIEYIISEESKGLRADQAIAQENSQFSRSLIQKWIKKGNILVNNKTARPKDVLFENDKITIIPEASINSEYIKPQDLKLEIVYEDDDVIVINKESNIISHPAAGHGDGTIANGLVYLYPELENLPRSGLIHRLDKDTTGLLMVARTIKSYTNLVKSMQEREIKRVYIAFTHGLVMKNGQINQPIARHKADRKKMSVNVNGKEAITNYEVMKNFKNSSKLKIKLHTGRTHQIRVHMNHIGYPIIGDQMYGAKTRGQDKISEHIRKFPRQALHAVSLSFEQPNNKKLIDIKSELPNDIKNLENILENE